MLEDSVNDSFRFDHIAVVLINAVMYVDKFHPQIRAFRNRRWEDNQIPIVKFLIRECDQTSMMRT